MTNKLIIKSGDKFGRFTVVSEIKINGKLLIHCLCDCGNTRNVGPSALNSGRSKSCGCLKLDKVRQRASKHNMSGTPTYKSWEMMIQRCTNPAYDGYSNYGGRGITVDKRWVDDFNLFLTDMGKRPNGTTLDRIDVNGNYCITNCRWANSSIQGINKRVSKHTTDYKGVCLWKGKYRSYISVKGKRYELGTFKSIDDAIAARKAAEKFYYPEVYGEKEVDTEDAS